MDEQQLKASGIDHNIVMYMQTNPLTVYDKIAKAPANRMVTTGR